MRLIPVTSAGTPTAACDPVHFGGIEVFINGRWARICNGDFRQNEGDLFHPVAAQVRNGRRRFSSIAESLASTQDMPHAERTVTLST